MIHTTDGALRGWKVQRAGSLGSAERKREAEELFLGL